MRGTERPQAVLSLALLVPVQTAAQQSLHVVTATGPISLDGRLGGPAWAGADSITEFRQREPAAGAPPGERTPVKVVRGGPGPDSPGRPGTGHRGGEVGGGVGGGQRLPRVGERPHLV